jgi:hypothetical protein
MAVWRPDSTGHSERNGAEDTAVDIRDFSRSLFFPVTNYKLLRLKQHLDFDFVGCARIAGNQAANGLNRRADRPCRDADGTVTR